MGTVDNHQSSQCFLITIVLLLNAIFVACGLSSDNRAAGYSDLYGGRDPESLSIIAYPDYFKLFEAYQYYEVLGNHQFSNSIAATITSEGLPELCDQVPNWLKVNVRNVEPPHALVLAGYNNWDLTDCLHPSVHLSLYITNQVTPYLVELVDLQNNVLDSIITLPKAINVPVPSPGTATGLIVTQD